MSSTPAASSDLQRYSEQSLSLDVDNSWIGTREASTTPTVVTVQSVSDPDICSSTMRTIFPEDNRPNPTSPVCWPPHSDQRRSGALLLDRTSITREFGSPGCPAVDAGHLSRPRCDPSGVAHLERIFAVIPLIGARACSLRRQSVCKPFDECACDH